MRRQANYDALTGLPNRSLLRDRLSGALKSARRERWKVALLFVDLDRFKEVNDSLGHVAGDELLQRIGERLRGCVREADTVARFGGDEFVLLLEDIKQVSDAADVCKKILRELDGPVALHGRDVFVGASIGVTRYPDDAADANTMLRNADMAMYRAKDAGRNNYQFFTLAMNEQVQHRIELERDLRQALEQGQLLLHYQPIVRLDDLRVVGVEALLRWRHPERGLVLPDTFITLAEESGLIAPVGRWVLRMACRQAGSWRAAGPALKVSVNLSSHQLAMGLEVGEIQQILGEEGLNPEGLNIEITESTMMEGSEANLEWLEQAKAKAVGVRLAIDDFGTGYLSLSYLKRFPMDTLKIDRTFIRDVEAHPEDISLIEAIIAMAGSLGLQVVAEGIENPAQLELMRRHGCDLGQGNLFSEALEPGRIPDLVRVGIAAAE
ncbi:MAG: EAL domain-containing protein [Candidatus Sedimenticola endophacoides]